MSAQTYIKSERLFTTAGEQSGALAASLKTETLADLQAVYLQSVCSPHWANPVFGHNFKSWMNHVARELIARGIISFRADDCLGPRTINVRIS